MISVLAWLIGSKAGRIVAVTLLALASVALVLWQAFRAGGKAEKAKQLQATVERVRERIASDETITRLGADERRRRLREWARD